MKRGVGKRGDGTEVQNWDVGRDNMGWQILPGHEISILDRDVHKMKENQSAESPLARTRGT